MKKYMTRLCGATIFILLSACSTPDKFAQKMNALKGQSLDEVKRTFGNNPGAEVASGSYVTRSYMIYQNGKAYDNCIVIFTASRDTSIVSNVQWHGNGCVAP